MAIKPISANMKKDAGALSDRMQGVANLAQDVKSLFTRFRSLVFRPQGSPQLLEAEKKGDKVEFKVFAEEGMTTPKLTQSYSLDQFIKFLFDKVLSGNEQKKVVEDLKEDGVATISKSTFAHLSRYVRMAGVVERIRNAKKGKEEDDTRKPQDGPKPKFDEEIFQPKSGAKDELDEEKKPLFDEKIFQPEEKEGKDVAAALEEYVTAVKAAEQCPVDQSRIMGLKRSQGKIAVYCKKCGGVGHSASSAKSAVTMWNEHGPISLPATAKCKDNKKEEKDEEQKKFPEGKISSKRVCPTCGK